MERQRLLVRTLVELADTSAVDYDVVELLYELTERCVELFDAAAAGVLLRDPARDLEVVTGSSHDARELLRSEAEFGEGPAWQAFVTGRPVTVLDLRGEEDRWPRFAPRAATLGLRSVHAEPLCLRETRIGALSVVRADGREFTADDRFVAAGLAQMAAIGMLHDRERAGADEEIRQLRFALDSRAVVEQAKVLLAERLDTDPGTAFDWLRRYARNRNRRLRDVAQQVLDGRLPAAMIADEQNT